MRQPTMLPRVGVFPVTKRSDGGIFQYSQMVLAALAQGLDEGSFSKVLVFVPQAEEIEPGLLPHHDLMEVLPLRPVQTANRVRRLLASVLGNRGRAVVRRLLSIRKSANAPAETGDDRHAFAVDVQLRQRLIDLDVDLMVYPSPMAMAFEAGIPYVVAVHDLQHRLQPQFEEVSADGMFAQREYTFANCCHYARAVLVDSQTGKEDVLNCYGDLGIAAGRIHPLPFVLPPAHEQRLVGDLPTDVMALGLPERFIYYPAQFWSHKNHLGLIRALVVLRRQHGLDVPLVLVGSNNGSLKQRCYQDFMAAAEAGGITGNIHYLGYVSDDVLYGLYRRARALVMMTFFGPTNIPVIEAWACGCAVVTSDLRGIREQCQDAALLADPTDPAAIADAIRVVWEEDEAVERLRANGYRRLQSLRPEGFRRNLIDIVAAAATESENPANGED